MQRVEFFARFESNGFARGYADFRTGTRVAADTGLSRTDAEYAKPAQFDSIARSQRLLKPLEYRVDCRFRLCARQTGALDDVMHDILLDQNRRPFDGKIEAWTEVATGEMLLGAGAVVNPGLLQYHKQFEALRYHSSGKSSVFAR